MSVYTLSFGKYIGKCLCDVAVDDPAYVVWLAGVITKYALKEETMAACKHRIQRPLLRQRPL